MKYLLILSWMRLGGAERQAINLADHIIRRGDEATILGICEGGRVNEICAERGIPCVSFPPRNTPYVIRYKILHKLGIHRLTAEEIALLGLIRSLTDYIRRERYDVCISYCTTANIVLGNVKTYYPDSVCMWYQGDAGIYDRLDGLQMPAVRAIDEIISNGITAHDWILKAYGRETPIIYNGVMQNDPRDDRDTWRSRLEAKPEDTVCTMIANLTSAKDHMFLLKTWKRLINDERRYILAFAGIFAGEYETLRSYAEENGLSDYVRFLGHVEDVYGLLNASDICVFGAKSEGSPNGIIEGCLRELPVVSNNLPEIREAVSEENYPYLFETGDDGQAAEHIRTFANDPALRASIGAANREKALRLFDPVKNFDAIMELSERMHNGKKTS